MKEYDVTITATIRKTLRVEADSEEEATEIAHGMFSVMPEEGTDEDYNENTDSVEEIA